MEKVQPEILPRGFRDLMESVIPEKAYFRIGEVSKILNVESYVIRYWETEFRSVKPVRTRSAQRLYRKKDVQELLTIRDLLYSQRFTIDGAKKQLAKMREEADPESKVIDRKKLLLIKQELQQIRRMIS
jgi:DNA-binding transcriptional MerR regulator